VFPNSGPSNLQLLPFLLNLIHDRECIPSGRREGTLVSVPKSGDFTSCTYFQGVTLLSAISKLFSNMLLQRMSPHAELNNQYGFRHGRGTADALFALDATVRPCLQRGELTYLFFLDWRKANDRVCTISFSIALFRKALHENSGDSLWPFTSAAVPARALMAASLCPWLSTLG
jgi:hypothetical protein